MVFFKFQPPVFRVSPMGSFSLLSHIRTTHSPGRKTALQRLAHTPPVTVNISNTAQRPSNFYLPPPKFHGEFGEAAVSLDGLTGLASPNGKASGFWMSGQSKNYAVIASRLGMDTAPMAARIESLTAVVGNFEDAIQIKQKGEWIITDADGREIGRAMLLTGGAEGRFDFDDEKSMKLMNKIKNGFHRWFTFLTYPNVEPTNNTAERALREHVVIRKIIGGLRSMEGARVHEVIMSCFATWKLAGLNLFDTLVSFLRGS